MMTIREAIEKSSGSEKGIYLRSCKSGDLSGPYNNISEIDKKILSQATPGFIEVFGRVIIDVF